MYVRALALADICYVRVLALAEQTPGMTVYVQALRLLTSEGCVEVFRWTVRVHWNHARATTPRCDVGCECAMVHHAPESTPLQKPPNVPNRHAPARPAPCLHSSQGSVGNYRHGWRCVCFVM